MNFLKKSQKQGPKILRGRGTRAAKKASSFGRMSIEPMQNRAQKPGLFEFTMRILYKNLYLLGITLLRRRLRLRRSFKLFRSKLIGAAYSRFDAAGQSMKRLFIRMWDRSKAPFLRIGRTYKEVKPDIKAKRAAGKFPLAAYSAILESVFRLVVKIFATIFNYTAPVVAAVIFVTVVQRGINEQRVHVLEYNGEVLGYVENESDFDAATQDVRSRVTVDGDTAFEIKNPHFEMMTISQFMKKQDEGELPEEAGFLPKDELADTLIRKSGSEIDEAYGLYIDGAFLGAVLDKDTVLREFDRIKLKSYKGKPDEELSFVKSIRLKPGLYPRESVATEEDVISILSSNETSDEIYIAKQGDTPSGIADKTGVPYDVIKELNPDIEDKLVEGMEIYTQVAHPFMSVQNTYTDIVEEEVPFETVENQNATYVKGYRDVYQQGENGLRRVVYRVNSVDGLERDRNEISYEMIRYPVTERITVGISNPQDVIKPPTTAVTPPRTTTPPATQQAPATAQQAPAQTLPAPRAGFIWPVGGSGGSISCYINGYPGHTGIDISQAGGQGTPILAAASGTVVTAKNTGVGYGRYVIIDHGNGYQTLYAHNSVLYVSVGERVAQGQVIAGMGRTGNATGVHLHFEVRYLGRTMNPVNYVGSR